MDFEQLLGIYVDRFGEDHDLDTINLKEDSKNELIYMMNKAMSDNKPISKTELIEFLGYDANDPDILI
jgi:hypothetical protein